MSSLKIFSASIFYLCIPLFMISQTTVTVADGSWESQYPFYATFPYLYSQHIYLPGEIGSGGAISAIEFEYDGDEQNNHIGTIYMGHTSKTSFTNWNDWIDITNLSQVWSGTYSIDSVQGWYAIELDNPFNYNGIDQLVIAVDQNTNNWTGSGPSFYSALTDSNRTLKIHGNNNFNPTNPPTADSKNSYVPSLKLVFACTPINLQVIKTNVSCPGGSDGGINVSLNPSGGPYAYQWNNGDTTQDLINISAGNYELTITTSAGCDTTIVVPIFQPPPLQTSITWTDASCGNQDGTATMNISNPYNPPYHYYWGNGDSLATADSLSPGALNIVLKDANHCHFYDVVMIGNSGGALVDASNFTHVTCPGGSDGSISLGINTQDPPYSVNWMSGQTTDTIIGLGAGVYHYMVQDQTGCMSTGAVVLEEPDTIVLTAVNFTNPTCGNADGAIQVTGQGGTGNLTYIWDSNAGSQVSATASGLPAGNYTVNIIDANSCVQTESILLDDISGPQINIINVVFPQCGGGLGGINISVIAGTPPYTYQWSNGSTNEDLSGVLPGNYDVVVTDANGCSSVQYVPLNGVLPQNPGVCLVTVDSTTETNLVVWEKPLMQGKISHYNIYREGSAAGVFDFVESVPYDSLSQYTDVVANPAYRSWSYQISVTDTCGNESQQSPTHKTIHLTTNLGLSNNINLIWDNYGGFSYPTYYINRYHPTTGWQVINSVASTLTSYTDPSPPTPTNDLIYSIEVIPPATCTSTKAIDHNSTRSNKGTISGGGGGGQDISDILFGNIRIYPNPTGRMLTLELKQLKLPCNVLIKDLRGRQIYSTIAYSNMLELDFSLYEKGIYLIGISNENFSHELKIIRQ